MTAPDHAPHVTIPGITGTAEEPRFFAPWQARAFALTVAMEKAGVFDWPAWTAAFSARLAADEAPPESSAPDDHAARYFTLWLETLETLVTRVRLTDPEAIARAQRLWQAAARNTPHGEPILFEKGLPAG
ncbi:MAG: nitrile hydratase accessory protein [Pseudooceanicola sp.]